MKLSRIRYALLAFALIFMVTLTLFWHNSSGNDVQSKVGQTRVSFLAVGDIMLSRGVANSIANSGNPYKPFEKMSDIFLSTDFNFGNLESPVSGDNNDFGKEKIFNTHTRNLSGLRIYNFKMLNLANNHAFDQGLKGLLKTRGFLDRSKIDFVGTGANLEQAWKPKFINVKGVKIAFVGASYASINDNGTKRNNYIARLEDTENLKKSIKQAREKGADFIVATMHAGDEYRRNPNKSQIDFARAAIDYGADIVIGAHPHWTQIFQQYKGKYIFYSLGNFIFDQNFSRETSEGLTLKITLNKLNTENPKTRIEQIELIPVVIEGTVPRPANEIEAQEILRKIGTTERFIRPLYKAPSK
jgi:poly-gamma-glutamate synthesis protein (capsule biosynthesis protein)